MAASHLFNIAYIAGRLENLPTCVVGKEEEVKEAAVKTENKRSIFSLGHLKDSFYTCFVNRSPKQRNRIIVLFLMAFVVMVISAGQ
jgi:hypothetical protein